MTLCARGVMGRRNVVLVRSEALPSSGYRAGGAQTGRMARWLLATAPPGGNMLEIPGAFDDIDALIERFSAAAAAEPHAYAASLAGQRRRRQAAAATVASAPRRLDFSEIL